MYNSSFFPRVKLAYRLGRKIGTDHADSDLLTLLNEYALVISNPSVPETLHTKDTAIIVTVHDTSANAIIWFLAQILLGHHLLPSYIRNNDLVIRTEIKEFIKGYNATQSTLVAAEM